MATLPEAGERGEVHLRSDRPKLTAYIGHSFLLAGARRSGLSKWAMMEASGVSSRSEKLAANDLSQIVSEGLPRDFATELESKLHDDGKSDAIAASFALEFVAAVSPDILNLIQQLPNGAGVQSIATAFDVATRLSAPSAADQTLHQLCEPENTAPLYQGKRKSGPVDDFLRAAYPSRPGARRLSTQFLRRNDPRAIKELYRLEPEARAALGLMSESEAIDDLLRSKKIDVQTDAGREEARRVYSAISSRIFQGHKPVPD